MNDSAAIRDVVLEQLHAFESASSPALAAKAGCTVPELIAVLNRCSKVVRVAGDGCWWWRLVERTPGDDHAKAIAEQASDRLVRDRQRRAEIDQRERVRGAMMKHPGGATISRISEMTRLSADETRRIVTDQQREGMVEKFVMTDIEFYKCIVIDPVVPA